MILLAPFVVTATLTCGEVKQIFINNTCCGQPDKIVSTEQIAQVCGVPPPPPAQPPSSPPPPPPPPPPLTPPQSPPSPPPHVVVVVDDAVGTNLPIDFSLGVWATLGYNIQFQGNHVLHENDVVKWTDSDCSAYPTAFTLDSSLTANSVTFGTAGQYSLCVDEGNTGTFAHFDHILINSLHMPPSLPPPSSPPPPSPAAPPPPPVTEFGVLQGGQIGSIATSQTGGGRVTTNADGTVVAIYDFANDYNGMTAAGTIDVFQYDGGVWAQVGNTIGGASSNARIGEYGGPAFSADGQTIVYVSPHDGSPIVRTFDGSDWTFTSFGSRSFSVDISEDGMRIVSGSPSGSGSTTMWHYSGGSWTEAHTVANGGNHVRISGDGNTVVSRKYGPHKAYVYKYIGGAWTAWDNTAGDGSIHQAVNRDGTRIAYMTTDYVTVYDTSIAMTMVASFSVGVGDWFAPDSFDLDATGTLVSIGGFASPQFLPHLYRIEGSSAVQMTWPSAALGGFDVSSGARISANGNAFAVAAKSGTTLSAMVFLPVPPQCDDTLCTSAGNDCCAPPSLNEEATCDQGLIPLMLNTACEGFAGGSYTCCP